MPNHLDQAAVVEEFLIDRLLQHADDYDIAPGADGSAHIDVSYPVELAAVAGFIELGTPGGGYVRWVLTQDGRDELARRRAAAAYDLLPAQQLARLVLADMAHAARPEASVLHGLKVTAVATDTGVDVVVEHAAALAQAVAAAVTELVAAYRRPDISVTCRQIAD
ncbi:MAG: hypothetical protein V7603_5167 [Micromonosporaceae bacterium]